MKDHKATPDVTEAILLRLETLNEQKDKLDKELLPLENKLEYQKRLLETHQYYNHTLKSDQSFYKEDRNIFTNTLIGLGSTLLIPLCWNIPILNFIAASIAGVAFCATIPDSIIFLKQSIPKIIVLRKIKKVQTKLKKNIKEHKQKASLRNETHNLIVSLEKNLYQEIPNYYVSEENAQEINPPDVETKKLILSDSRDEKKPKTYVKKR